MVHVGTPWLNSVMACRMCKAQRQLGGQSAWSLISSWGAHALLLCSVYIAMYENGLILDPLDALIFTMLLGRYAATFLAYSWDQSLRLGFAIYGVFDFTSTYCFHGAATPQTAVWALLACIDWSRQ